MKTHGQPFDIAIVGAGIVGASIAYFAAPRCRVLILEAESVAGYHSTGRSAALFIESYGPPSVRTLTRASRPFFENAPAEFSTSPLLRPRGALTVGSHNQRDAVARFFEELSAENPKAKLLDTVDAQKLVPVLKAEAASLAVYDEDALDIDVDLLLQGFLKGARAHGAVFQKNAKVQALLQTADGWRIETNNGQAFAASCVVNCAGAWADEVAAIAGVRGIGIEPRRRSAFLFEPPPGGSHKFWPLVADIDDSWYFKPDAGLILGSPANADLVLPHDVVAEDLDIAIGVHHIEAATTLNIGRPSSSWAGLRSFVTDGNPVCGFDSEAPEFFWAAALGGYGIQTSPAFGRLCAELLIDGNASSFILEQGVDLDSLSPNRIKRLA